MEQHLDPDERTALALDLAPAEEAAQWQAHLDRCADCREALAADRRILDGLASLPVPEPSAEEWRAKVQGALDRARRAAPEPSRNVQRTATPSAAMYPVWLWRAALLALVFGAGYWAGGLGAHEPASAPTPFAVPRAPLTLDRPRPDNLSGQDFSESRSPVRPRSGHEFLLVRIDDQQT
jgi:anti-sigma factor RsiW